MDYVWALFPNQTFEKKLGTWVHMSHQQWRWYHSRDYLFYLKDNKAFWCWKKSLLATRRSQSKMYFESDDTYEYILPNAHRATMWCFDNGCVYLEGSSPICVFNVDPSVDRNNEIVQHIFNSS